MNSRSVAFILVLICTLLSTETYAQELKKGMPFKQGRKLLLKEKWRPVNVHKNDGYEYLGLERNMFNAHITEVDACAVDRPLCVLHYKKGKDCLRLITQGESLSELTVSSWTNECPE